MSEFTKEAIHAYAKTLKHPVHMLVLHARAWAKIDSKMPVVLTIGEMLIEGIGTKRRMLEIERLFIEVAAEIATGEVG